jgi:thiosulfate dehydrogenase [quinone] large subunit
LLAVSDFVNAWGLALIGFFLLLGCLVRPAALGGMVLLGLYYLSHPPFPSIEYLFPVDGTYFVIDKTLWSWWPWGGNELPYGPISSGWIDF